MNTNENNEIKIKWGILDILLVLVFIFILTKFFTWLAFGLTEDLLVTEKYLISIVFQAIAIIFALVCFSIIKGVTWKEFGIRGKSLTNILKYGVSGGIVILALVILTGLIMEFIFPKEPFLQPFAEIVLGATGYRDLIVLLMIGAILVPIGEELYFRGMVYPVLKERWGLVLGIIASGIFFSLLHADIFRFLPLLLGGIVLAYVYEKSGSLFACMLAHGLWNGIMIFLLYYSVNYFAGF